MVIKHIVIVVLFVKNYLIFKINQFVKNQKRQESYDNRFNEINEDNRYSYDQYANTLENLNELIKETIINIEMIC